MFFYHQNTHVFICCCALCPTYVLYIALHSVKTGSSTVHNFETLNGLRFTLYTSNDVPTTIDSTSPSDATVISARDVLKHIYSNIYVEQVVRSPLYTTDGKDFDINHTNFERDLDSYMKSIPWFR